MPTVTIIIVAVSITSIKVNPLSVIPEILFEITVINLCNLFLISVIIVRAVNLSAS